MLEWARTAERLAAGETRLSFDGNELLQLGLTRVLQIIGEAANNVTAETRRAGGQIPWLDIIGMRHRLVHVYYAIDLKVVWTTASEHIRPLIVDLEKILDEEFGL